MQLIDWLKFVLNEQEMLKIFNVLNESQVGINLIIEIILKVICQPEEVVRNFINCLNE